jgi:hypothetical protein
MGRNEVVKTGLSMLIASGEQPEVVALAVVLLGKHPGEIGAFGSERLVDVDRRR